MNLSTYRRMDQDLTNLWRAGMEALDVLGIGWLACDAAGRLLGANRVARRILKSRDGLQLNSGGVPCMTRGRELAEVVQVASASKTKEDAENHANALIVKRAGFKRTFTLLVRSVDAMSTIEDCTQPVVLVLILDPSLSAQPMESDLRQLYGFTPREACLATLLMDGSTLDRSCHELGITRSTGRTYIKRMFKKTRVRRQSELVSVLLKTIGLIRLGDKKTTMN